jgi:quercetin dioxygenase-like cupin family protein
MREGPTSLLLFAFDRSGELKEHATDGLVCIHVLRGRVHVSTDGRQHELGPSELMFLRPNAPHGLVALEESDVLVSIQAVPAA